MKYCKESRRRGISSKRKKRKVKCMDHSFRRNCSLNQVTEGKIEGRIEVTGRRGRRRNQVPDDVKEKRG